MLLLAVEGSATDATQSNLIWIAVGYVSGAVASSLADAVWAWILGVEVALEA